MPLLAFLSNIPAVVWSGIIASLLTLSGVFLSNWSNTKRLRLQLQHDGDEKAKERTATLRREIYLRTVEELVKANAHLAGLPQLDLTKTNLADGLQGFLSAAARLQLVAEPRTALLVGQMSGEYGEMILGLMISLVPVNQAGAEIRLAEEAYAKATGEVNRVLGEMSKINESGKPDPNAFGALTRSFEFHQAQAATFAAESRDARLRFNRGNIGFQRLLLTKMKEIGSRQTAVLVAIRSDLGLSGDLAEYEAYLKKQWLRTEKQFDELMAALEASGSEASA